MHLYNFGRNCDIIHKINTQVIICFKGDIFEKEEETERNKTEEEKQTIKLSLNNFEMLKVLYIG